MTEIINHDPRLYNEDLAPTPADKKNWGWFEIFNVWANDVQSLFGYTLAASLFLSYGLNGWAVFGAIILAGFFIIRDEYDTGLVDNPVGLPVYPYEQLLVIQVGNVTPAMRHLFQPLRGGIGILVREIAGNFEACGIMLSQQRFDKIGNRVLAKV